MLWDFRALDRSGKNRVSVTDSMLLFKIAHGSQFSMHYWKKFLGSRKVTMVTAS